jgi:putative flippase GtrA
MKGEGVAPADGNGRRSAAAHWGGFIASGSIALLVDGAVLEAGIRLLQLHPLLARLLAISTAMVAGWLSHRTLTFALQSRPSAAEFARYATMAWTAAAINYGTFASILLLWPETWPLAALVMSCVAAGIFSYLAMRFGVFRGRR